MKRGIVVTTSEYTKDFLKDCLDSLPSNYPILVVSTGGYVPLIKSVEGKNTSYSVVDWKGYEAAGILRGSEEFDEFVHLPDTCKVLKPELIDMLFAHDGSVSLSSMFFSCIGKYVSSVCKEVGVPKTVGKHQAMDFECHWHRKYIEADKKYKRFEPELLIETDVFGDIHGQRRMIIDNGYIVKYKGTYGGNAGQVKD